MPEAGKWLARVDAAKSQLDGLRPLDREQQERLMQVFRLRWTFHSNALEGNTLTEGETRMFLLEGLTANGKPLKDHLDLRGHSNAVNFLLDLVRRREPLTEGAHPETAQNPFDRAISDPGNHSRRFAYHENGGSGRVQNPAQSRANAHR